MISQNKCYSAGVDLFKSADYRQAKAVLLSGTKTEPAHAALWYLAGEATQRADPTDRGAQKYGAWLKYHARTLDEDVEKVMSGVITPAGIPKSRARKPHIKDPIRIREYNNGNKGAEQPASHYDAHFAAKPHASSPPKVLGEVLDALERIVDIIGPTPSLVDIGCGTGPLLEVMKKRPALNRVSYQGYDFSEEAIVAARKRNPSEAHRFNVGICYDPKLVAQADIVCASEMLEHVQDLDVIRNIPVNAYLVATVPNFGDAGHVHIYNPEVLFERWGPRFHIKTVHEIETPNPNLSWSLFVGIRR